MKEKWNLGLVALVVVVACTAGVFAQCGVNPAGTPGDGCPDFIYDPVTGLLEFSADGENVQSMLITGPDPGLAGLLDPDGNFPTEADITGQNWTVLNIPRVLTGTYSYFQGRSQNIMFTDTANTGWVNTDRLAVINYGPGLTQADFHSLGTDGVEMSTWDTDTGVPPPSMTIFTDLVVVPEPAVLSLLGAAVLGLALIRRR